MASFSFIYNGCDLSSVQIMSAYHGLITNGNNEERVELADYIILKTCICTDIVINKTLNVILQLTDAKKSGKLNGEIIIVGCITRSPILMNYLNQSGIKYKIISGVDYASELISYISSSEKDNSITNLMQLRTDHIFNTSSKDNIHFGIQIETGCNNKCTFCKNNYMNNRTSSIPYDELLAYLNDMIKKGARSIILSGDNITQYGIDLYGKPRLHELISELSKNDELLFIHIHEITIQDMYPELLIELKSNKKIANISIQIETASDKLLKLMNRRYTVDDVSDVLETLFQNDFLSIDTTIMSGFPCETLKDISDLIRFLKKYPLHVTHQFSYVDSSLIPSHNLPQLLYSEKINHARILRSFIKDHNLELCKYYASTISKALLVSQIQGVSIFDCGKRHFGYSLNFDGSIPKGTVLDVRQAIYVKECNTLNTSAYRLKI